MKLCADCFNDEEIKRFIKASSSDIGKCECCSKDSILIDFVELADFLASLFSLYTTDTNGTPLYTQIQKDWNLFSCSTRDIQNLLDEILPLISIPFGAKTKISHIDEIKECLGYWDILKQELKSQKRFLTNISDYGWDTLFDVNSIIDKNTPLYRARIHHDKNESKPFSADKMGCPPISTAEGRANPKGINYLYLSKEKETTFYETRSLYLDYLSIGVFHVKESLTLKITDFTKQLSPFNNATDIVEFTKGVFLRKIISSDLSKPLMRFDSELEYIPTQFICEFIRYFCNSDGVQFFSSLKNGGVNLVLFDEDKVECTDTYLYQIKDIKILGKKI